MLQNAFKNIKIRLLLLSGLLFLAHLGHASCLKVSEYSHQAQARKHYQLEQDIESYYSLIEESLNHRATSLKLFDRLTQELHQDEHLSAKGLTDFKQAIKAHLQLRERLYQVTQSRQCWLRGSFRSMDPQLRLKGIMLSLSAALTLYDNYLLVIAMFQENDQLRRIIDQPDKGFGLTSNHLLDASLAFHSVINREKVKYGVKFYQDNFRPSQEGAVIYLSLLIEQSPSYQMMQKHSPLAFLHNKIKFYTIATSDSLKKLEQEGVNLLSLIFGNTIGMIESRKGKLYRQLYIHNDLLGTLKPGDILLEKTPFRLTDQFIPGYWGHAAIWVGNEDDLKQLGLWHHPLVKPWHQQIREGASIIQALRSGVELDPLSHFMNIDDMVVLRDKAMTSEQSREVIVNAFRQLGKSYDFNFDVSTSERIVCSELVYISYVHIDWPTEKTLGRYTISPDHIAVKAQGDLQVVKLYLDGKPVTKQLHQQLANTLKEN